MKVERGLETDVVAVTVIVRCSRLYQGEEHHRMRGAVTRVWLGSL